MRFRKDTKEEPDLNLTPLIDVVFLLLIFFMVSTTFQKETELSVQLPKASQDPPPPAEAVEQIEIVINAAGLYFVNEQELVNSDANSLIAAMHDLSGGRRDMPLTIRADAKSPHEAFVTAMDAAAQLGMLKISIAASFKK